MAKEKKTDPAGPAGVSCEEARTGTSLDALSRAIIDNLKYVQGRHPAMATRNDWYMALAYTVRDRILDDWVKTIERHSAGDCRIVSYLSAEFLMGPHLGNAMVCLGLTDRMRAAAARLGIDLDEVLAQEEAPGLGNGGLGRLAACYLDSLATLDVPALGYGIRYEFGIFDQEIREGWQVEVTDKWLGPGNPWEIPRPEIAYEVKFGGHTEQRYEKDGGISVNWVPNHVVKGVAYDTPVPGYRTQMTNMLRLWKAEAVESFDFQAFNVGDYYRAVEAKVASETISKILYPNDNPFQGKRLRLEQQYFFASCSLQDMLCLHHRIGGAPEKFHEKFAIQLNDTHPSIAVAELMRLLVDEHRLPWDTAWDVTRRTFSYTNHTLMPEALEKWALPLFASVLPRHLEIIYEINRRFLDTVRRRYPGDEDRVRRMSLFDESGEKYVRMAHLAAVGSHAVNGVSALHTELLKREVMSDFHQFAPEMFLNVTNGVTPRRWMVLSNPAMAALISKRIGDGWPNALEEELSRLEPYADDPAFLEEWRGVKRANKRALARAMEERTGIVADPDTMFDVQVKRIHEYKRQLLNILHVIALYHRFKNDPAAAAVPRTAIFGGKAAPGYFMAKLIIKLINSVAEVVNADPDVAARLKVIFIPDLNVKIGQMVYPGADLSEQISTAGKEASGTGNMKFALNGALTIGTLDGANVEIREAVGAENFFLFGLTVEEVGALRARGYHPRDYVEANPELRAVIEAIDSGAFSRGDRKLFRPLIDALLAYDTYMVCADYQAYVDCQDRVDAVFRDERQWTRMSVLNTARMGRFSSDRSIRQYCEAIWNVKLACGYYRA